MKESKDDKQTRLARDLALADDICREIRNDHPQALNALYDEYHTFFIKFTTKRLLKYSVISSFINTDPELSLEIVQDFWSNLMDGDDICGYKAQNDISLKSYLTRRLLFRTIDAYRRLLRRDRRFIANNDDPDKPDTFIQRSDALQAQEPEIDTPGQENIKIMNAALDILSDIRPNDASLVRYIMMEKTYDEIAVIYGASSESDIKRKSAALRQQFLRAKARLRIIIERLTEEAGK
jgi:DNA-directed RNA polymerase specialized sigma24 family protein